jgi:hypothetical protein
MTADRPQFWDEVRPWFHEYFQFWPDHEDLIWAKSIWLTMEREGFFSENGDEAEAWTKRHILALAILYAGSATAFGVPDYRWFDKVEGTWLAVVFGSRSKLDEILDEVGRAVCFSFPGNQNFERDPAFFTPLIRSLVTGSGFHVAGPKLEAYLARVEVRHFEMCEFREDELCQMWIGGSFSSDELSCFP